jgi:hypothetical protein
MTVTARALGAQTAKYAPSPTIREPRQ